MRCPVTALIRGYDQAGSKTGTQRHFAASKFNEEHKIRLAITAVSLATLLVAATLSICAIRARHQVVALFAELRNIDASSDHSVAALSFLQSHHDSLSGKQCQADICQYELNFTNKAISRFHVVPVAKINVYMTLKREVLAVVFVEYSSAIFKTDSPIVGIQEDFCARDDEAPACNYFFLHPHGTNATDIRIGIVDFGRNATQAQKLAGWGLNVNCFTAPRGCKDVSELMPAAWKLTAPGAVSSRVRSMGDSIADSQQPLP